MSHVNKHSSVVREWYELTTSNNSDKPICHGGEIKNTNPGDLHFYNFY